MLSTTRNTLIGIALSTPKPLADIFVPFANDNPLPLEEQIFYIDACLFFERNFALVCRYALL